MYPLSAPIDCCCFIKYFDEFPAIFLVTLSIRNINTATNRDSQTLDLSIAIATEIIVIDDDINIGRA